jgi:4-amino-4-deoxy-L-arabinose transferase-like glycosyltransferase
MVIFPEVIYSDGIEYIRATKQIISGNWTGSKAPPLYPVLIALTSRLIPNFELAGIWISVIFGTLAIIPVFYLGKNFFNKRVGILSALLVVVHPFLYLSSGSVLTEAVYHFLLPTAVLFSWKAFNEGRLWNILLFSLFTTLAYLTRPEAIGYLFVFTFWVLFIPPPHEGRRWLKRVGIICLVILCFLVFSSPYLLLLREETGKWTISKKFSISLGSLSEDGTTPIENFTRTKKITLVSFLKEPLTVFKKIVFGWFQALYMFQRGFHPLLFLLAVLGFFWSIRGAFPKNGTFYLLSYFIFYFALLLPFFWVWRRYTSLISTLALPWASLGFIGLMKWITSRLKEEGWRIKFPALSLLLVLIIIFSQGVVAQGREHRLVQKELGLWMKDHLSRGGKIMSRLPQEAFYAEMDWVRLPEEKYEEILKIARLKNIDYVIVDDKVLFSIPDFREKAKVKGELQELFELQKKDRLMILFKMIGPSKER